MFFILLKVEINKNKFYLFYTKSLYTKHILMETPAPGTTESGKNLRSTGIAFIFIFLKDLDFIFIFNTTTVSSKQEGP